jgi:hypothetical protein
MPSRAAVFAHLLEPLLEARGCIQLFRLISVGIVIWYERITFTLASLQCSSEAPWLSASSMISSVSHHLRPPHLQPSSQSHAGQGTTLRLTILSDPQLIESHTYAWIDQLIFPFSTLIRYTLRWASDTYAQKSFTAVVRQTGRAKSNAVIWLGDLLDGGRRPLTSNDDVFTFEKQARRFKGLFEEKLPSIYLPGNHDVRIPLTHNPIFEKEWRDSRARWLQEWGIWQDDRGRATWSRASSREHLVIYPRGGPEEVNIEAKQWKQIINARYPLYLNESSSTPTHEIIMVDSLELAGMLPAAIASNLGFDWHEEAKRRFRETYDFVQSFAEESKSNSQQPQRILISHIPLNRPANLNCNLQQAHHGVTRESSGAIDQGVDQYATYQNLLSAPVTDWVLESMKPQLIFSGDNHDHCEIQHRYGSDRIAQELTLKAFSMTEGVRLPGYARLSLHLDSSSGEASSTYAPCLLPDQISIWTRSYPVFLFLIFASLMVDRRWRLGSRLDQRARIWRLQWQDWIASWRDKAEDEDEGVEGDEDLDWHMVEEGAVTPSLRHHSRSTSLNQTRDNDNDDDEDSFVDDTSISTTTLHSTPKRIRYGKTSLALQPLQHQKESRLKLIPRIGASSSSSSLTSAAVPQSPSLSTSSFQKRAWRELQRAAKANEKVVLRHGPLREMARILIWPLVVWLWLQLF